MNKTHRLQEIIMRGKGETASKRKSKKSQNRHRKAWQYSALMVNYVLKPGVIGWHSFIETRRLDEAPIINRRVASGG